LKTDDVGEGAAGTDEHTGFAAEAMDFLGFRGHNASNTHPLLPSKEGIVVATARRDAKR